MMKFIGIFILFASLLHQNAFGIDLNRFLGGFASTSINSTTEGHLTSSVDNSTEFRNGSISEGVTDVIVTEMETNSSLNTSRLTQSTNNTINSTVVTTTSNESHPLSSSPGTSSAAGIMSSSTEPDEEAEGVARGKPNATEIVMNATTPEPETLFGKAVHLINDTYTLSILLPIVAGVVFATTILLTIAMFRCLRRTCRRRRLRRKVLPDSVKNLRPSDRARLLAESSDEEF